MKKNKYEWNFKDIFETEEAFNKEYDFLFKEIENFNKYKNKLSEPKYVLEYFEYSNKMSERLSKIFAYAFLKYAQDMKKNKNIEKYKRIKKLSEKLSNITYYIAPELNKNSRKQLYDMMGKETKLKEYKREIDDFIEDKKHILSFEEEKLLSSFGNAFSGYEDIYDILTNTELDFGEIEDSSGVKHKLSNATYSIYLNSHDNLLRKNAFDQIYKVYSSKKNTISELLLRDIKLESISCKNRKYSSSMNASLISDESSEKVYNILIESVKKNLDKNHKWIKIKNEILTKKFNLDKINMYDVYVNPFEEKQEKKIEYEEAKKQVLDALAVLGEEYVKLLNEAFSSHWLDVYPKENKQDGAFSYGVYGVHPYVLLNYVGLQNDVSTIAHELRTCYAFILCK